MVMLASGFFAWLSGAEHRVQIIFVALAASALVLGAWAFAWAWVRVRRAENRSRLTSEMLQRGMNPAEIARVLLAYELTSPESIKAEAEEAESADVRLIKALSSESYDGEDIQRILAAARGDGALTDERVGVVREMAKAWAEADDIIRALETGQPPAAAPIPPPAAKRGRGEGQPSCA
jgi:hypothetical protein